MPYPGCRLPASAIVLEQVALPSRAASCALCLILVGALPGPSHGMGLAGVADEGI